MDEMAQVCVKPAAGVGDQGGIYPGGNPGANIKKISHREVAFEWELTKETIYLPLGCLQGGDGVIFRLLLSETETH